MAAGKQFHDCVMATPDSMKKMKKYISIICSVCYVRQFLICLGPVDIDTTVLIKRTAYFKAKLAILCIAVLFL